MQYRTSSEPIAATLLYFENAPPIVYPDRLPVVDGVFGRSTGENALRTSLFGRDALIRTRLIGGVPQLVVAYVGKQVHERRLVSLLSVIDFVFGREHALLHEDAVDARGKLVRRRLFSHRATHHRHALPAILCDSAASTQHLGISLPVMVERAWEMRYAKGTPVDVAIKYLLRFNDGQLDLEIRDITSALSAMVESPANGPRPELLIPKRQFRRVWRSLASAIRDHPVSMPARLRDNLINRLKGSNDIASFQRRSTCFYEAVGFTPSKEEVMALRRRHVMAHVGYIDTEDAAEERALYADIQRARTFVNEAILSLLGYDGNLVDYDNGCCRRMRIATA